MGKSMKQYLIFMVFGIVTTILVGSFLLLVSLDMRWMGAVAIILSFITSFWREKPEGKPLVKSFVFSIPFAVFFYLVIKPDLPSIWFLVPAVVASSLLGQLAASQKSRLWGYVVSDLLLIFLLVWSIPLFVGDDLTRFLNEKVEAFEFTDHDGNIISSVGFNNSTVIIDFYGTWCKPCIAELPKLAKVRDRFSDNPNVKFYVVNADQGGDNLEKAKRFEEKYGLGFTYAYDEGMIAYKKLGLASAGVPSLVILDPSGNVRLKHIGFNASETDFVEKMISHIESISRL